MERKGDWTIINSDTLKQKIAYDKKSGWLFCEDGTRYNPRELSLVTARDCIPIEVHLIKKMFSGEIVSAPPPENGKPLITFGEKNEL